MYLVNAIRSAEWLSDSALCLIGCRTNSLSVDGAYNLALALSVPRLNNLGYRFPRNINQLAMHASTDFRYLDKFAVELQYLVEAELRHRPTGLISEFKTYNALQRNQLARLWRML